MWLTMLIQCILMEVQLSNGKMQEIVKTHLTGETRICNHKIKIETSTYLNKEKIVKIMERSKMREQKLLKRITKYCKWN